MVVAVKTKKLADDYKVIRSELLVVNKGLKLAQEMGQHCVILEGDSRLVFEGIESSF